MKVAAPVVAVAAQEMAQEKGMDTGDAETVAMEAVGEDGREVEAMRTPWSSLEDEVPKAAPSAAQKK